MADETVLDVVDEDGGLVAMTVLDTLAPSAPRLDALVRSAAVDELSKRSLVTRAYLKAASSGNSELLEWLLNPVSAPRSFFDINQVDEDGNPAIILAAVFGHGDAVRVLTEHGADVNAIDARGWTALHWSFQTGNLPLSSYLINRRASTSTRSHTGLAAVDLIRKGSAGEVFRDVVREIAESEPSSMSSLNGDARSLQDCGVHGSRPASLAGSTPHAQHTARRKKHSSMPATTSRAAGPALDKHVELAIESAHNLGLDFSLLDISLQEANHGSQTIDEEIEEQEELDADRIFGDEKQSSFAWEDCTPEQMFVFSLQDLPGLLDIATEVRPSRAAHTRHLPANVVFLAARYASRYGGEDLLGELMIGAIDRIEANIHAHPEDLANSAFWLSNSLLLLYYLRRDPHTAETTIEYQENVQDLIREIFVFCIRDTERRLDKILDASLLEHEALPGFEDVRFEGEWRFVKALTSRGKKDSYAGSLGGSPSARPSVLGLFGTPERNFSLGLGSSPTTSATPPTARMRTPSMPTLRQPLPASTSSPQLPPAGFSPKNVTGVLSSTLFILQLYDLAGHPVIIVQAFSQLLYWMASELFNRILSKKRYLCRSRAIQIRLNVSALEDWARTNRLPTHMVTAHFKPLNELLQWLQCLSSEVSIDGLLSTMQNLHTLNPLQMRKALREYRYEIDEPKMSEECMQYLAQLQKDWERRKLLQGLENAERERQIQDSFSASSSTSFEDDSSSSRRISLHSNESSRTSDPRSLVEIHIDTIFGPQGWNMNAYEPPERPESLNEALESRVMLPFALPTLNDALVCYPSHTFGPLQKGEQPRLSMETLPKTSAISSSQPLLLNLAPDHPSKLSPALPDDFLEKLDEAKSRYFVEEYRYDHSRHGSEMQQTGTEPSDHWLNWRERMQQELAEAEAKDGDTAVYPDNQALEAAHP